MYAIRSYYVNNIININKKAGDAKLYIVHLSNHLGMEYINKGRKDGLRNLFAETCPQYLFLNDENYLQEDGSYNFV